MKRNAEITFCKSDKDIRQLRGLRSDDYPLLVSEVAHYIKRPIGQFMFEEYAELGLISSGNAKICI